MLIKTKAAVDTRPSVAHVKEGERTVAVIRPGGWGDLANECAIIEAYQRGGGRLVGPYSIDYLPGGMWKLYHNDAFIRYCNSDDVREMAHHIANGQEEEFLQMAHDITAPRPDRGDRGPIPAVVEWVEGHDDALVRFCGYDTVWNKGCYELTKPGFDRQLLDPTQLTYIAEHYLGMPKGYGDRAITRQLMTQVVRELTTTPHNLMDDDEPAEVQAEVDDDMLALFAEPEESEGLDPDLEALFRD